MADDVDKRLKDFGFGKSEEFEFGAFFDPTKFKTGYPKPNRIHHCIISSFKPNIEEVYYWLMNHARYDFAYHTVDKIMDLYASSEHSTLFGVSQQRLGIQQDRVTQYLATIGKFIKELFQMVRELRVIDEKMEHYVKSYQTRKENAYEISLKGMWIDLVEGGAKNPASVYGMARELQFTTLPDLFFSAPPLNSNNVESYVASLDFNKAVKNVLARKLATFLIWKEKTHKELVSRRKFMVKYLRQHFEIIKMYMDWVKPYLRYINRLQSKESYMDSPDMVSTFESAMMEIEILLRKKPEGCNKVWACILMTFQYVTTPSMAYQAEGYQRGPLHGGEVRIFMRSYAWTDKEIENYKKMRDHESLELIGTIDESLKAAMEALGDDLENYLEETEKDMPGEIKKEKKVEKKEEDKEEKKETVLTPFIGIAKGFGELFNYHPKEKSDEKPKSRKELQAEQDQIAAEKKTAQGSLGFQMYTVYKNFKKTHGMTAWR